MYTGNRISENASDQSQNMSISKYAVQIEGLSKKQIFEEKNTSESHEVRLALCYEYGKKSILL